MTADLAGVHKSVIPNHLAIIMDGNGRWATRQARPRWYGHRAGAENLRRIVLACLDYGIKYLTVFAFSTENWGRPQAEVQYILSLPGKFVDQVLPELHSRGVQLRHLGSISRIDPAMQRKLEDAEALTRENRNLVLSIAFNYGGRDELLSAARAVLASRVMPAHVTPDLIAQHLYTTGLPDPDLVIRTSGECRVSNFLIWQAAHAEWYFTATYWPDFDERALAKALGSYRSRRTRD